MSTFQIQLCGDQPQYVIVDDGGESLSAGSFWSFSSETQIFCGVVIGDSAGPASFTASTNYDTCYDCLTAITPTLSAGTNYEECLVCYELTGNTVTSVSVPHPTWTDNQGNPVIQLDAVQLGGMNGLNN